MCNEHNSIHARAFVCKASHRSRPLSHRRWLFWQAAVNIGLVVTYLGHIYVDTFNDEIILIRKTVRCLLVMIICWAETLHICPFNNKELVITVLMKALCVYCFLKVRKTNVRSPKDTALNSNPYWSSSARNAGKFVSETLKYPLLDYSTISAIETLHWRLISIFAGAIGHVTHGQYDHSEQDFIRTVQVRHIAS